MNIFLKILQAVFYKKTVKTIEIKDRLTHSVENVVINEDKKPSAIRIAVTALTIGGASLLAMTETNEGKKLEAYKDSVGVPTIGIGTIKYRTGEKAGQAVRMGDTITDEQAYRELKAYYGEIGEKVVESLKKDNGDYVAMTQGEFDIALDFVYNFGIGNWQKSSIRRYYLQGEPMLACEAYLKFKYAGGKDCSNRKNGCYGVWLRTQKRRDDCLTAIAGG